MRVEIAKAIILAGNTDDEDHPWPSVKYGVRQLVPVANRPILFHNLDALRTASLLEATIVAEPKALRSIRAAVGDGSVWGIRVHYTPWLSRSGITGALTAARPFAANEPILVERADALLRDRIHPYIATFAEQRLDAMALRLPSVGVGEPAEQAAGCYLLSPEAVSILVREARAADDPLAPVRGQGGRTRVEQVEGCLTCGGGQEQLLRGNRHMLETLRGDVDPACFPTCEFQGPVSVHPTARLDHTLIRGPVVIGPRCQLSHAYVGPYSSIGADVTIDGSQIEHSIVLEQAELRHVGARLESSVIGRGARVSRDFGVPRAMRLSVGDSAEVTLT
jgi:glucose-1-phosphate thymidylyltransferase